MFEVVVLVGFEEIFFNQDSQLLVALPISGIHLQEQSLFLFDFVHLTLINLLQLVS